MNIGEKIYHIRKENNLSQEEFGYRLNVSRQTISKWELNQSKPEIDKIELLCQTFNMPANYFINASDDFSLSNKPPKRNSKLLITFIVLFILSICISILLSSTAIPNYLISIINVIMYVSTLLVLLIYLFYKK